MINKFSSDNDSDSRFEDNEFLDMYWSLKKSKDTKVKQQYKTKIIKYLNSIIDIYLYTKTNVRTSKIVRKNYDDLVQFININFLSALDSYDPQRSAFSFFYAVVENCIYKFYLKEEKNVGMNLFESDISYKTEEDDDNGMSVWDFLQDARNSKADDFDFTEFILDLDLFLEDIVFDDNVKINRQTLVLLKQYIDYVELYGGRYDWIHFAKSKGITTASARSFINSLIQIAENRNTKKY